MEIIHSFQSNEILTGIAILSVLRNTKKLEIAKCLLIEPLLSYKSVRDYLKNNNCKVRSIEELMVLYALSNFLIMFFLMVSEVLRAYFISGGREYEKRQNNTVVRKIEPRRRVARRFKQHCSPRCNM